MRNGRKTGQERLFVLVCSCHGYHDRKVRATDADGCKAKRDACRQTWLSHIPEGVRYAFFVGGAAPEGEPDVWALDAPDTYHGLPEKVRAAFIQALNVPGWKWLFKCDDDTYCVLSRLLDIVDKQLDAPIIISWPGNKKDTAHGGAGYLLPRSMVQAIVADELYNRKGIDHEDKQVTYSVRRAGGKRVGDARFHAFMKMEPTPQNEQITCHQATPEDMLRIHAAWMEAPRTDTAPAWLKPQCQRLLPSSLKRKEESKPPPAETPLADGLNIPRGTRRVVIFSNVVNNFDPRALPLQPGDHCIHINRARQFFKVADMDGITHALVVRRGTERANRRIRWYDPPVKDGFTQVLHIADVPMRARRPWWRNYCQRFARKCPTSGFICWHLAQEAAPSVPVVLVGFAPGEHFGTPQWHGHAWAHEAEEYARAGAHIVRPDAPGMSGNLPRVKCLVMVCSGMQHHHRRAEIRDTWAGSVPDGMAVRFWCGGEDALTAPDSTAADMVCLPGIPHKAEALPAAMLAMMRWAVAHWNFDRLFCCHDDTFTALDRLNGYTMPRGASMVGNPDAVRGYVAMHGGAGFLIARDMVELLAFQPSCQTRRGADVYISQEVQRQGGVLMPDRRFYHSTERVPALGNAQITAHGCKPGDMVNIMQNLTK